MVWKCYHAITSNPWKNLGWIGKGLDRHDLGVDVTSLGPVPPRSYSLEILFALDPGGRRKKCGIQEKDIGEGNLQEWVV